MSSLTIGAWVRAAVPTPGRVWGYWAGKDLLTKKHFPGTPEQKGAVESMGAFGAKMDATNMPIFEFRGFREVPVKELGAHIKYAINFLRQK
jgi:hypothetical protein